MLKPTENKGSGMQRRRITLMQEHCNEPCILEMDCPEAVRLIKADGTDRSENFVVVQEIKLLL
jgi:hypothetical protein